MGSIVLGVVMVVAFLMASRFVGFKIVQLIDGDETDGIVKDFDGGIMKIIGLFLGMMVITLFCLMLFGGVMIADHLLT